MRHAAVGEAEVAADKKNAEKEGTTLGEVRTLCDHTLYLFASGIEHMEEVLWPHLLEYITPSRTPARSPPCAAASASCCASAQSGARASAST